MSKPMSMALATMVTVFAAGLTAAQAEEANASIAVEITARNVNLLEAAGGDAAAADPNLGKINVLRVTEIKDAEGNPVEGLAGKVLHYLPVAAAAQLMSGDENADKLVVVKGLLHRDMLAVEVREFEVKVEESAAPSEAPAACEWDDWDALSITTMSQQQVI